MKDDNSQKLGEIPNIATHSYENGSIRKTFWICCHWIQCKKMQKKKFAPKRKILVSKKIHGFGSVRKS
jgi:hypothetical protein